MPSLPREPMQSGREVIDILAEISTLLVHSTPPFFLLCSLIRSLDVENKVNTSLTCRHG